MIKTYFITGAEGVGKTTSLKSLRKKFPEIKIYDFDEIGVPDNPPLQWRFDTTLFWIKKAIKNQKKGLSTCIIGLSFPSEIKKFKESKKLEEIIFILLDISKKERVSRLSMRKASQEVIKDTDQLNKLKKEFSKYKKNKINTSHLSREEVTESLYHLINQSTRNAPSKMA